ncbi:MAG: DEAD/DEAH box helicase [Polyangiaceae bacterium]
MENSPQEGGFGTVPGLVLSETAAQALSQDGIQTPTAIQSAAFEPVLQGRNVVIQSGTGTGKTLAYVLPLLQRLAQSAEGRVVCIAPSSELALQTLRVVQRYKEPALNVCALVPGTQNKLQQSTRFVVGTAPGVLEMYAKRKLKGVTMMVLDEPEPILAGRDAEFLREVLSRPEPKVQLIFVAATFGRNAERWISERLGAEAVRVRVEDNPLKQRIAHGFVRVRSDGQRDQQLARFIREQRCQRAVVFVNQPSLLRHLYRFLNEQGISAVSVSPERSKAECKQALADFNRSLARVLLTTDRVATGLDVPGVAWVLHYELPSSAEAYVHRAGRTGRAGKHGRSVLFVNDDARPRMERMASELDISFEPLESFHKG